MNTHTREWIQELQSREISCILEVKEKSPFGWVSPLTKYKMIKECEKLGADIISIHTNEFWGGSWNWLKEARSITKTPILAKGFHPTQSDINMAISCGADFVLTVGWWNGDHNCFHECESLLELSESKARTTVWNSRDPRTGQKRYYTEQAVLTHRNPHNKFLIQASGIEVGDEIPDGVNAILIGQGLWKQYE